LKSNKKSGLGWLKTGLDKDGPKAKPKLTVLGRREREMVREG